jgi:hypothetical protein
MLLVLAAILLAAPGQEGLLGQGGPPFRVAEIHYQYPFHVETLNQVRWKDLDFHLFWDAERPISDTHGVKLKDGRVSWDGIAEGRLGWEKTDLHSVTYCGPYAIADVDFSAGGGSGQSFSLIQLFQVRDERLELLAELSGRYLSVKPNDVSRLGIDCADRTLTAGFQVWRPKDPDCCPTKLEVVRIAFGEGRLDVLDQRSLEVPQPRQR